MAQLSKQNNFECAHSGCTSTFARKSDLNRHDRTHTQLRPHKCEWPGCQKAFNQKGQLKTHQNTHTGERPHKCGLCVMRFGDPASRTRHRKEAHGNKATNQCPVCNTRIKRVQAFKKHIRDKHHFNRSADVNAGCNVTQNDSTVFLKHTALVERRFPPRGAYMAPSLDTQHQNEAYLGHASSFHPKLFHTKPDALELVQNDVTLATVSEIFTPWQELGSMSPPSVRSALQSLPISSKPHMLHGVPTSTGHDCLVNSPGSSTFVLPPIHLERCMEPVYLHLPHYNSPPLVQPNYSYRASALQSEGVNLPIDPALLSLTTEPSQSHK